MCTSKIGLEMIKSTLQKKKPSLSKYLVTPNQGMEMEVGDPLRNKIRKPFCGHSSKPHITDPEIFMSARFNPRNI